MLYWYLRIRNALVAHEEGQDLIEYALLAALIAVVAIVAIRTVGNAIPGVFNDVSDALGGTTP